MAHSVSNQAADAQQLMEMIEVTEANLGAAGIDEYPDTVHHRCRLLLGEERHRCHRSRRRRVHRHRAHPSTTSRCRTRRRGPDPKRRHGQREDGTTAAHQEGKGRLRQTQSHRRAGLRPDEGPTRRPGSSGYAALTVHKASGPCTRCATTCASWPGRAGVGGPNASSFSASNTLSRRLAVAFSAPRPICKAATVVLRRHSGPVGGFRHTLL